MIIKNIFNIKNIKTIFEIIVKCSIKLIEQNLKQIIRIFNQVFSFFVYIMDKYSSSNFVYEVNSCRLNGWGFVILPPRFEGNHTVSGIFFFFFF